MASSSITISKNIKNIIFDLGGVILNIDYDKTKEAFKALGIPDFEKLYSQASQNNLFDLLETGKINPNEFRNEIRRISQLDLPDKKIDMAWCAMLLDLPLERIDFLIKIGKKYRIFLLSNTNQIHIEQFNENIFDRVFEGVYYSSQIGKRKPNPSAFHFVLKTHGLLAHETFFIDDSPQHVEGAIKAGLQSGLLEKEKTVIQFFSDWA